MKKLIIAAAVAVVSIGAFAADGYDFTATLKTTKGKSGKDTVPVNLGANKDATAFWYDARVGTYFDYSSPFDAKAPVTIKDAYKEKFELKSVKGTTVPKLTAKGLEDKTLLADLRTLQKTYGYKSAGVYCLTFKVVAEDCYRVAGTVKIDVDLFTSNCCAITVGDVLITNYFDNVEGGIYIANDPGQLAHYYFINRFGSLNYEKATKVEMYAEVKAVPTTDGRVFVAGELAGQGTYSTKDKLVNTVSGNIVGFMTPPVCPNCCTLPTPAVAFECDDSTANYFLPTAAFGTFRLKYNKKKISY